MTGTQYCCAQDGAEPAADVPRNLVRTKANTVFGERPLLAIEACGRRFFHRNLDFNVETGIRFYAFTATSCHFGAVPVNRLGEEL